MVDVRPNRIFDPQFPSVKSHGIDRKRLVSLEESEYPESRDGVELMTLCVATASQFKDRPAVALCSDTRSLSGTRDWGLTISSENADKSRYFGDDGRFGALVAGIPTAGDELLTLCDASVKKFSERPQNSDDFDLYINELLEDLRIASRTRMKQIQEHFIAVNSPFRGFDDFLARGKASLPEIQYRELWRDIASLTLDAEVIIAGIHSDEAVIIKIDNKGNPHWEDQYSVIGTGAAEGLAFLAQNEYDEEEIRLEDALMRMVETLDFVSTANNTVGHMSRFEIHLEDRTTWDLKDEFFKRLKSKIRLRVPAKLGDCGDFLEKPKSDDEVSSSSEKETAKLGDASDEQPSVPLVPPASGTPQEEK
jgi:hypothetical protein